MATRRDFLAQSALVTAALAANPVMGLASAPINDASKNKSKTKMELAAISWCFGIDDLDELFKTAKEAGFDAVQFCGDHKKYKAADVLAVARKYGMSVPSYDPGNGKPQSKEYATLANAVDWFKETIDYAAAIGAKMATLQGLGFWTVNTGNYAEAMQFVVEASRQLCAYAKEKGILMTYEACCHYELPVVQDTEDLLQVYNEVKSDNLLLVLDSFHINITETDMLEPIRRIGKLLYSYHISDSGRGGIGTGQIDFLKQYQTLKEIGFEGLVCFELVIKEARPYKFPMQQSYMDEYLKQSRQSLAIWKSYMENY